MRISKLSKKQKVRVKAGYTRAIERMIRVLEAGKAHRVKH